MVRSALFLLSLSPCTENCLMLLSTYKIHGARTGGTISLIREVVLREDKSDISPS